VDSLDYSQYIEELRRTLATTSFHPHIVKKVFNSFNIPESQHAKLQNLLEINIVKLENSIEDNELLRQDRILSVVLFGITKMIDIDDGETNKRDIVKFIERYRTSLT